MRKYLISNVNLRINRSEHMYYRMVHCVWLLILSPLGAFSQFNDPNLQAMVDAERAFIQMAREKNTRDAFLYYLSDEAVTAGPNGPVIGKDALKKQPVNAGLLSWEVAYCDIASSGDFGYNTGPWEFRAAQTDTVPVAYGQFHSVWKKQPDGAWKNILDIGIRHGAPTGKEDIRTSSTPLRPQEKKTPAGEAIISLMNQEKAFLDSYRKNGLAAYNNVSSSEIRFSREGELPIVKATDRTSFLKGRDPYYNPQLVDGGIAASGDMGYVYGTADAMVFINDKQETKQATYLRIWKKEPGKGWRIVIDVMAYQ